MAVDQSPKHMTKKHKIFPVSGPLIPSKPSVGCIHPSLLSVRVIKAFPTCLCPEKVNLLTEAQRRTNWKVHLVCELNSSGLVVVMAGVGGSYVFTGPSIFQSDYFNRRSKVLRCIALSFPIGVQTLKTKRCALFISESSVPISFVYILWLQNLLFHSFSQQARG